MTATGGVGPPIRSNAYERASVRVSPPRMVCDSSGNQGFVQPYPWPLALMDQKLAVSRADFVRADEFAVRHVDTVELALDLFDPEAQKAI